MTQDKASQDETRQDKTGQDKIRQGRERERESEREWREVDSALKSNCFLPDDERKDPLIT